MPSPVATKLIKNYSIQGHFILLETSKGVEHVWLEPKKSIRVPETQIGQQIKNLHKRRIIQITN